MQPNISDAPPGYHGRCLRVDVGCGSSQPLKLPEHVLRRFLGGAGLGAYLMLQQGAAAVDPLDPAAPLAFVFSPLVGSPLTTSAKFAVVAKSPLTHRFNDSLASSRFALDGKRTGYDALLIVGRAAVPSILIIDDDGPRCEPAEEIWGMPTGEAEQALRERFGRRYSFAVVGPAGERRVRFATISHDGRHAGRGGHGAVFGAKNLKAIAVTGSQTCRWSDPETLAQYARDLSRKSFGPATEKYRELGTAANLPTFNRLAALPTRNFQQGSFDGAAQLSPAALSSTHPKSRASCAACTIGCEHLYQLPGNAAGVRVEYENLFALGPLCGVAESQLIIEASRQCDQWGLDTISAGGTIAFAMECVDRGLLDEPWLRFGDGQAMLRAIDLIGTGRGLGAWLGEGTRAMSARLGGGSAHFAAHVKGLELPGYEPRAMQTMALGLAVGTRGADHNRSGAYEADFSDAVDRRQLDARSAQQAVETENRAALLDSLILCKFLRNALDNPVIDSARMLQLVTGWDVTEDEINVAARRIVTAKKLFNVRAGWKPAEDRLPDRFHESAVPEDADAKLGRQDLQRAILHYNRLRGWTDDGTPGETLLAELSLQDRDLNAKSN